MIFGWENFKGIVLEISKESKGTSSRRVAEDILKETDTEFSKSFLKRFKKVLQQFT